MRVCDGIYSHICAANCTVAHIRTLNSSHTKHKWNTPWLYTTNIHLYIIHSYFNCDDFLDAATVAAVVAARTLFIMTHKLKTNWNIVCILNTIFNSYTTSFQSDCAFSDSYTLSFFFKFPLIEMNGELSYFFVK